MSILPPPPPIGGTNPGTAWNVPLPPEPEVIVLRPGEEPEDVEEMVDMPSASDIATGKRQQEYKVTKVSGRVAALLKGEIAIEDLDDEELQRGQLRSPDGKFHGRRSNLVPRSMYDEMQRRLLSRANEKFRANAYDAIDTISGIMKNPNNDPAQRLKAADMILTRVMGKPIDRVEMSVEVKPWEKVMQGIMKQVPDAVALELEEAVEAEVVQDADE